MTVDHPDEIAAIFNALSTTNRVQTLLKLHDDEPPTQIATDLDVTRSALQPYLNDFKQLGLVEVDGKTYRMTEKGEAIVDLLAELDELFLDLSTLQEFLIENPEVIPDEVLDEVAARRNGLADE